MLAAYGWYAARGVDCLGMLLSAAIFLGGRAGTEIAAERILDTMVGATIGLVFALIISTLDERTHIEQRARERLSLPRQS